MKMSSLLSLQSPETTEPGSFIVRQRMCVHNHVCDQCRTCSMRENWDKTSAELFVADLDWHACWKESGHLDNAITLLCYAVIHTLNLSQAISSMVDVDVHELLTNLQCLVETKPTKHNFMALMNSVKSIMDISIQGPDPRYVLSNLIDAAGKLGVTLERLSAEGSKVVDASCKQLMGNPDSSVGNFRWAAPPSEEWRALNIDRIAHLYSCNTLLMCLARVDNNHEQSDLNLRARLTN